MNLLYAAHLGLPKLEFLVRAFHVGSCGRDLLGARAADQFVQARLLLCKCRVGSGEVGDCPRAVLFNENLAGNHRFSFGDEDRANRLADLGGQCMTV